MNTRDNWLFHTGPYYLEQVEQFGLIGIHSLNRSHIAAVDTHQADMAQCQATARLFKAAPDLFHLLIQARNQLRLLGDVAPLPALCHDIDKTIDEVWGTVSKHPSGARA